ncbi:MAG: sigma-54-dependent transcriptional regulator [Acidobacteriota bacterium]
MGPRLLLVTDETSTREALTTEVSGLGAEVVEARDGNEALELVSQQRVDGVITGLKLKGMDGLTLLQRLHEQDPELPVILVTAYGTVASAVQAMKAGAFDFIEKPFDHDQVRRTVQKALAITRLVAENRVLREEIERQYDFSAIIGTSPEMLEILRLAGDVARTDATVLITGESGTGKELLARAIHYNSQRGGHHFVAINCATLPENLLESELFGYEQGAFTGAEKRKIGRFELAAGGTLFLDEIGDMTPAVQVKLLRVLEEGEFTRLGGTKTLRADVRLLVATNQNLAELVGNRQFRDDLYYRINVFPIVLPSLRERPQDILPLARYFLGNLTERTGKVVTDIKPEARRVLLQYGWPGNIRELKNVLERAVILTQSKSIEVHHLPARLQQGPATAFAMPINLPASGLELAELERRLLQQALERSRHNKSKAARLLGLSRATLRYRLKKFGLDAA